MLVLCQDEDSVRAHQGHEGIVFVRSWRALVLGCAARSHAHAWIVRHVGFMVMFAFAVVAAVTACDVVLVVLFVYTGRRCAGATDPPVPTRFSQIVHYLSTPHGKLYMCIACWRIRTRLKMAAMNDKSISLPNNQSYHLL